MNKTCSSRNELANDHVFFQTKQRVFRGGNGGSCQHFDGVLEGSCGQEGISAQRCFGHTQQDFNKPCGLLAFSNELLVGSFDLKAVNHIHGQVMRVAWTNNLHFANHLADDHFKMFVINVLTLGTIHLLNFGHQVNLGCFAAFDLQNGVRIDGTFSQRLAGFHFLSVADDQA
ncbi:MAG: hypothetical protein ACD_34C00633G0004 [uncultured bacterium]|nr:MAG: hypothetical protein ACD_34C00633G0004 [uncultured bacterium]